MTASRAERLPISRLRSCRRQTCRTVCLCPRLRKSYSSVVYSSLRCWRHDPDRSENRFDRRSRKIIQEN